jgi:hypothetical protein
MGIVELRDRADRRPFDEADRLRLDSLVPELVGTLHPETIAHDATALEAFRAEMKRAAEQMKEILASLCEEDRRSLVHHPDWKGLIGNLLDTLVRTGRRDEALGYLVAFGVASCEVQPTEAEALAAAQAS